MKSVFLIVFLALVALPSCIYEEPSGCEAEEGACSSGNQSEQSPSCETGEIPTVKLGWLSTDGFHPYVAGGDITVQFRPSGGVGLLLAVQTTGLAAGEGVASSLFFNVENQGVPLGENSPRIRPHHCHTGKYGELSELFNLDHLSDEELSSLNGSLVDLVVTVVDTNDASITKSLPLVFRMPTLNTTH